MKKLFTFLCALAGIGSTSYSQDLVITEISYNGPESGTDSTEYIELYNNSSSTIDLTGYSFSYGVTHAFYAGETIAPGAYYVVAYDSVAVFNTFGFLPNAQFTGGLSNSGEAVVVINGSGVVQDSVSFDDVSPWPTTPDGFGPSLVLCDYTLDNTNGANWFASTSTLGLIVNSSTVYGSPGSDDAACSVSTLDTLATITSIDASVFENVGTVDVTIGLSQTPVLDKTVDLNLVSGNSAIVNGFTTQTVTIVGGTSSQIVTLTIVPGQLASASETLDFNISNPGSGVILGTDVDYALTVSELPTGPAACSELFFSEYIEGSSNNKSIEIYNPTTSVVNLSNYQVRLYSNGSTTISNTLNLAGNLVPGDVYVISNSNADIGILSETDITSGVTNFNGDDALELYNLGSASVVDVIGEMGTDPGSSWIVGTGATANFTLVRMAGIDAGTQVWNGLGDQQWDVYTQDDSSFLGAHTNTSCVSSIALTAYPMSSVTTACVGDTILFSHTSYGGTSPYTVGWDVNGSTFVGDDYEYIVSSAGTLTVTLAVVDGTLASDDSVFTIAVNIPPVNGMSIPTSTICAGDTAFFTSTATGSGMLTHSYSVSPTTATLSSVLTGSGYLTSTLGDTYSINQTVLDFSGCSSTASYTVVVNDIEDASFASLSDICSTDSLILSHANSNGTWSGTSVVDQTSGNGYLYGVAGDYVITYTTNGTCPDVATDTVTIFESPVAGYTFTGSMSVDFTNTSTGGLTYAWDFGDGSTSTSSDPSHMYAANGNYTVCLSVTSADGCFDSICNSVTIQGIGIAEQSKLTFSLYPNPTDGKINVMMNTKDVALLEIFNLIGEKVVSLTLTGNKEVDLTNLSKGSYFARITQNGQVKTEKLIIK